jgi:hypothetical protein
MVTSRTLLAFAYISDRFSQTGDIGDGLLKLFAPVIAKRAGRRFVPEEFAADVLEMYDIEMHPYVAEDFAPRLAAAGYLIETANFAQNAAYENGEFEIPEPPISLQSIDELLDRFADAADSLLKQNSVEIPRATLKSGLLDRLVQPDFLGLMVRPDRASMGPRTVSLKASAPAHAAPADAERLRLDYLSARFILDCNASNQTDFDLLLAISSGALATEVVLSLQHPPGIGDDFEGINLVLDGPLVMDALGLGQDGPVKYAKLLIDAIKRAKAVPVVSEHIVEEIEGAIRSPLENFERGQEVHGPLGRKLLKNSAFASYLRSILKKLPELIGGLGINMLPFSEYERLRLRTVFTETNEERLSDSIGIYNAVESKMRDARSIADVLRIRGQATATSISDCGTVFVTRNTRLARLSRNFLIREGLISREYFSPCITDRYAAGLLWITQGGGGNQLSRERLIANCTAAVMPRRDVITKMHKFLMDVNPAMAERFDALMTNERAEHFLMDRTIADVDLIQESNLEQIYRDVELIAGHRVAVSKDSEIAVLKSTHAAELDRAQESHSTELTDANERAAEKLRQEAARTLELEARFLEERRRAESAEKAARHLRECDKARTMDLLKRCFNVGQDAAKQAKIRIAGIMVVIAVALGLATRFIPDLATSPKLVIYSTVALIVLSQIFSVLNYFVFPDVALARYVVRCRDNALRQCAIDLNVQAVLADSEIDWRTGRIRDRRAGSSELSRITQTNEG